MGGDRGKEKTETKEKCHRKGNFFILKFLCRSHFSLNSATGVVSTATTTLDRETQDTYTFWCRVTDQGVPQRFDDVNVTITISDVNDNPPIFAPVTYTSKFVEN
jgi:hypothetical protein